MAERIYTVGAWRVKPGNEAAFIEAWKGLSAVFARLPKPPPGRGTLVQSLADPLLFYSFGEWGSLADVQAMRGDPAAQAAIEQVRDLCSEATPGSFRLVAEA
jgi:hypothetical protein